MTASDLHLISSEIAIDLFKSLIAFEYNDVSNLTSVQQAKISSPSKSCFVWSRFTAFCRRDGKTLSFFHACQIIGFGDISFHIKPLSSSRLVLFLFLLMNGHCAISINQGINLVRSNIVKCNIKGFYQVPSIAAVQSFIHLQTCP